MLNKLIKWSLGNRTLVMGICVLLLILGARAVVQLPVEVLPDLTKPTVMILTEAPGLAPEEVETRVTQPIERALMGVAGLTRLGSNSDVALSLTNAEFAWGTDIYKARSLVQEKLQEVRGQLPDGVQPFMTPVASLMGEILLVGVRCSAKEGGQNFRTPSEVRSIADWTIRPRLQGISGIAEVLNMGGGIRRIEVQPDPYRMQAYGVTFAELKAAAGNAASTTTGGFIDGGSREIMVRNVAMTVSLEDIAATAIKVVNGTVVSIGDVAQVRWSIEPMRGDAALALEPEKEAQPAVIMSITKAPGFDTLNLTSEIEAALAKMAPQLPPGIQTTVLFRQADFIGHAIGNLREAIRDGAIMVAVVIFLFLLNFRTTVITLMAMPLSFAVTLLMFQILNISVNSMTLGGLAVAIGMVVDDAIVDVENVYRRLRENAASSHPRPKLHVIAAASGEVRNSIFYATLLIILVFLPLLGLSGIEGRLFAPIAIATILSMIASFLVSLAAIPVLCSLLLNPKPGQEHREGRVARGMKWFYEHFWLRPALGQPLLVIGLVACLLVLAVHLFLNMDSDLRPSFKEETATVVTACAPGTSLAQMRQICAALEEQILAVEGVTKVGRRIGRAERGDHVVPVSTAEFDVDFDRHANRKLSEIQDEIRRRLKTVPGTFSVLTGPLADRIGHMVSGVSAPVAVKIFGPDIGELRRLGGEVQEVAKSIPGLENAKIDQQALIPQLRNEIDREKARAAAVTPGEFNGWLASALGGEDVAELRNGEQTINLVIRLPEEWRSSPDKIAELPVASGAGRQIPLSLVADVREAKGPGNIQRENGRRRFAVAIQPTAGGTGELVRQLEAEVKEKVHHGEDYEIKYEGEFQAQQAASQRILLLSVVILAIIGFLLHGYFRTPVFAAQVLCDIPLALIGGVALTAQRLNSVTISALVGFIAVAGVAARNSIMLISHYLHLMQHEGETFGVEMVIRGTRERLVPVLMTALSAGIGLIPLVLAADKPGKEILHPVAVVIVGGLVTSTLLGLGVTPTIFLTFGRKAAQRAIERESAASH